LAIPGADGTCVLAGCAWPGGSPGVTSSGRLLVMWLGIYTFTARMFGRAGRAMNAGGIAKPFSLPATQMRT
jgi:hypothetical protein